MIDRWFIQRGRFSGFGRCVVFPARGDPATKELDLIVRKRRRAERHPRLLLAFQVGKYCALLRRAGFESRAFVAARHKTLEAGDIEPPIFHCRLVTPLATPLNDGTNLVKIADFRAGLLRAKTGGTPGGGQTEA